MERPVILVHGILGQRHVYWNLFKRRLMAEGFRVHEVILPYYLLGDMRIAAGFLRDKVEATLRGDHAERVDLVCHSAGGLVARYYLGFLGGAAKVQNLVTLGTPHAGTYFSYLLGVPLTGLLDIARQSRPGSHFLEEISGPECLPESVRVTNLWSPLDGVVIPSHNALLPGADNRKLPWTTHWGFLWQRGVMEDVVAALEGEANQRRLET